MSGKSILSGILGVTFLAIAAVLGTREIDSRGYTSGCGTYFSHADYPYCQSQLQQYQSLTLGCLFLSLLFIVIAFALPSPVKS